MEEEKIKEVKRSIISQIQVKEAIPEEIQGLLEGCFDSILQIYKNSNCDISRIEEYINGNKAQVEARLNKIGENRKTEQTQVINIFFSRIQRQLGEQEENKEKNMKSITGIKFKDREITNRIISEIKNSLENVKVAQRKFLAARGYTQDRIQSIDMNIDLLIRNLNIEGEVVKQILESDSEELKQLITQEYEQYIKDIEKQNKQESENEKEKFKKNLDAGITLEEQHENAQQFVKQQEESKKSEKEENVLRDDVIY